MIVFGFVRYKYVYGNGVLVIVDEGKKWVGEYLNKLNDVIVLKEDF